MSGSLAVTALLLLPQAPSDPVHKVLRGFHHSVDCLAFSPDGKTLATGSGAGDDGKDAVTLWDIATGKEICRLGENAPLGCGALAFTPDGKTLVSNGSPEGTLFLWDVATRKVRLTLKVPRGVGGRLAVSPDSKTLAASDCGPAVRLLNLESGKEIIALEGDFKAISVAFSPDGKFVAGSSYRGLVVLWDARTGKQIVSHKKHSKFVNTVVFSPDSKTLYSLGEDRLLISWDTASGKERKVMDVRKGGRPGYGALSPDGKILAVHGSKGVVLFDLERERFWPGIEWDYQDGRQLCVSFSPDGKLLATGSGSNSATSSVYLYHVPVRNAQPR